MPRLYSSRLIALTTGLSDKWLDNLLSHFDVTGVTKGRQGVGREITDDGLLAIELARIIVAEVGASLETAVDLANQAIRSRAQTEARIATASGVTIVFHLASIEQRLREQMVHAVESVAHVRRGRPPARARTKPQN